MTATPITDPDGATSGYRIKGHSSYFGSDDPLYLRSLLRTGCGHNRDRYLAVLREVERDTPWIMRRFRDWRFQTRTLRTNADREARGA